MCRWEKPSETEPASGIEVRRVDRVRFFVALRMTANCDDGGKVKRQRQLAQPKLAATDANTFWRTILHLEDFDVEARRW